jgi:NAD(P)-dependent dehydrogenase (short-subunit alcohol dehydrogenase family)
MQSVLITGANSGIGRATAVRLATAGYRVYAGMRDTGKAEKLLALTQAAGAEVEPLQLDVTDDDSVRQATDHVIREAGQVDLLVNNAGIAWNATTEDIDIERAKAVFETNYWGVIRCIQAALPHMRERRAGHIVNISSIAGRIAALAQGVYSASKWALECLSENLAQETAPFGIRVTVIEPGVARTAILPKNLGHPEPTAYEAAYRRMNQFYVAGALANVPASDVAETIFTAISDPKPSFRYTCAWGGRELPEGRSRMSDDDWIALGRAADDESYYEAFERHFGLDLRTEG